MKKLKIFLGFVISLLSVSLISAAQEKDEAEIQKMIDSKNFVFKATSVNPPGGRNRQLTPEYDVKVSVDQIDCYLPYYGRSYSAPVNSEGGIKFTSTDFSYDVKKVKKGWQISMKPKNDNDVRELYLTAFTNGNASLQVTSNNRQNISFNGYIEKGKEAEKKVF